MCLMVIWSGWFYAFTIVVQYLFAKRFQNKKLIGEGAPYGVDINTGGIADSYANFVWEPAVVKVYTCYLNSIDVVHSHMIVFLFFSFFSLMSCGTGNNHVFYCRSML